MAVDSLEQKKTRSSDYDHTRWERQRNILRFLLKTIGFTLLARLDKVDGLEHVPASGPAILMINHIAFIDSIVVLHATPRNIVPLAKNEVYEYPVIGLIPRWWGVIPVRRDEVDRRAVQQVLEVLNAGEMVLLAPEGTRSPQLSRGKEGIAYLASRSNVPVIPVAVEGTPGFPALRFGRPFRFRPEYARPDRDQLRKMTDEAVYQLAAMLPEQRRGYYSDLSLATTETIEWA